VRRNDEAAEPYASEELRSLAITAARSSGEYHQHRNQPDPALLRGQGQGRELRIGVLDTERISSLLILELSPTQQRNLQETVKTASSTERSSSWTFSPSGRIRARGSCRWSWRNDLSASPSMNLYTKFERQQGGIGVRGGSGETKLETDRRKVSRQDWRPGRGAADVRSQRHQQRSLRRKLPFPAPHSLDIQAPEKSTLMIPLSGADVYADPKLFATLDPLRGASYFRTGGRFCSRILSALSAICLTIWLLPLERR